MFVRFGAMSNRLGAFIVSGAGGGIGLAIASHLAALGHLVYGLGRDRAKLQGVASTFPANAFSFSTVDLARADETHATINEISLWLKSCGRPLLGVVNNAGIFDRLSFQQTSDAIWERQFNGNLLSAVRLTRELYPHLKAAHSSAVVNISSTLGERPIAGTAAYSALKAAMINWTKTLALEWAPDQIRVNCLCPGLVDTPIHDFHRLPANDPARVSAHQAQPLGRMGRPEEIAAACEFLLRSEWTTGTILTVDGGISL